MPMKDERVRISNREHPHYPETGRWTGEVIKLVTGRKMGKVALDTCAHGAEACFVTAGDIKLL